MTKVWTVLLVAPLLPLAACSGAEPERDGMPAESTIAQPEAAQASPASQQLNAPATTAADAIPAAMYGFYDADRVMCSDMHSPTRLAISSSGVEFYESMARVQNVDIVSKTAITATFAFSGEGSNWTRKMELSLHNDGDTLRRQDLTEGAQETVFTYKRCA